MVRELRATCVIFLMLTVLTGIVYPLLVTGVAKLFFLYQAEGSVVEVDGRAVGSALLGQPFTSDRYFHGRPSATAAVAYNGLGGAGSNLAPTNPALAEAVAKRVAELRKETDDSSLSPPVDLVTTSASGLDPHVSPAAALLQVPRVAAARSLPEAEVRGLVQRHVEPQTLGILGSPRVNVLRLNLALDALPR
ncbi:MAG: potassium-transporting ATPase subunit KdpC [Planctomycetales bacterium]|nr:potassium-transporting ATPase subunit KdpC [Planctomycetales bacterium]MBN8628124.1 potassium-transporting ATPase subunit KdpC [Planctomycetota bacterium]